MNAQAPLRILVDLTHLWPHGESGGIKPALRETIRWLGQAEGLTFVMLVNLEQDPEAAAWARPSDRVIRMQDAPSDLAARENCDLVYCPFGITSWACPGIPTVTLIVDLLHRDFPESLNAIDIAHRDRCLAEAVPCTDLFQVISDYTAVRLRKHTGISDDKIVRTYLPLQHRLPVTDASSSAPVPSHPYFFYPANAWLHKNHETLLVAYAIYRHRAGPEAWRLVLTGHESERMRRLRDRARALRVEDKVDFLGYVEDARLAELWKHTSCLIFPSLHEGFGIPLLEAMFYGVPILAGKSTAIPEVAGEAALLVESRSPLALAEGMQKIALDAPLREALVARGRQRTQVFQSAIEFGRLLDAFRITAGRPARARQMGYYEIDGLIGQQAMFALPAFDGLAELTMVTRPLGIERQLEIWCGATCLVRLQIPAAAPRCVRLIMQRSARALTLHVPDASSLSETDPRTHGVILDSLRLRTADGNHHDLLAF